MPRAVYIGRNFPHTLPIWPWGEPTLDIKYFSDQNEYL